jgi:hypothetical protein
MAANLNFFEKVRNALDGENGNRCVGALYDTSVSLREKLGDCKKKRVVIPLAFPVGLARGALFIGAYFPAMAVDRIAKVIQSTRDPDAGHKEKLKAWGILPIKLAIIVPAIPFGIALIPIYAVVHAIRALKRLSE